QLPLPDLHLVKCDLRTCRTSCGLRAEADDSRLSRRRAGDRLDREHCAHRMDRPHRAHASAAPSRAGIGFHLTQRVHGPQSWAVTSWGMTPAARVQAAIEI